MGPELVQRALNEVSDNNNELEVVVLWYVLMVAPSCHTANVSVNAVPLFTMLLAAMVPPSASTCFFTM